MSFFFFFGGGGGGGDTLSGDVIHPSYNGSGYETRFMQMLINFRTTDADTYSTNNTTHGIMTPI